MAIINLQNKNYQQQLPIGSGVYQFLNDQKKPIYIGKAVNIKQRTKQHLSDQTHPKERLIQEHSRFLKISLTSSGLTALLLEANLIRKFQPKYNAVLLDDKSRLYIVVTKETYPKVKLVRQRDLASLKSYLKVFGPLSSSALAKQLLQKIRQAIPFCTEKKLSVKSCFYSQINLCSPCPNEIEQQTKSEKMRLKKQYLLNIKRLIKLLEGRGERLLVEFEKEIKTLSQQQRYEEAAKIRDRWYYLQALFNRQLKESELMIEPEDWHKLRLKQLESLKALLEMPQLKRIECYDVSNLNFKQATASMVVFINGEPEPRQYRRFQIKGRTRFDPEMLTEVLLRRSQHPEWEAADLVVIDGGLPQLRQINESLSKRLKWPRFVGLAKHPDRLVIFTKQQTISFSEAPQALTLLQAIRDEAHRFAKKYHLYLRHQALSKILGKVK